VARDQVARVVREGLPGKAGATRKQHISFMSYVFVTFAGPYGLGLGLS